MKPRSAKNKGVRLQNMVKSELEAVFEELRDGDVKPAIMGESGVDIVLSPYARDIIPFDIECKNTEKLNVWAMMKQAEENAGEGRIPLGVFKRNYSKVYACLDLEELFAIMRELTDLKNETT